MGWAAYIPEFLILLAIVILLFQWPRLDRYLRLRNSLLLIGVTIEVLRQELVSLLGKPSYSPIFRGLALGVIGLVFLVIVGKYLYENNPGFRDFVDSKTESFF